MSTRDTSGPAFPMIRDMRNSPDWDHEEGMTLRQYTAIEAMAALLMHRRPIDLEDIKSIARLSYAMADAMLAEGAK